MRVYLSGFMTGYPNWNYPAFHAAAAALRQRGFEVTNPAEIISDPNEPWAILMRKALWFLLGAGAVVLLPGWERSKGANLELAVASQLELIVYRWPDLAQIEFDTGIVNIRKVGECLAK